MRDLVLVAKGGGDVARRPLVAPDGSWSFIVRTDDDVQEMVYYYGGP